jgi:sodium-dependent phosphate cotransporter
LVSDKVEALQVALCHLFFNITGILIFYPIPRIRQIPLDAARTLGKATRIWKGFPLVYILVVFLFIPIILFGLSSLFQQDSVGFNVLGGLLSAVIILLLVWLLYKWLKGGLRENTIQRFEARQKRKAALDSLSADMESIHTELARLREHTGLEDLEETGSEKEDVEA